MLAPTQICDLYAWLYVEGEVPDGTWDHLIPVDGAYAAIKRVDGIDYVCFRGSTTFLDWVYDFDHFALPVEDKLLGPVHPGARKGVALVEASINALVGDKVVVVGHSLGAMHGAIYAGLRKARGLPLQALVMFGEPRPGGPKLSSLLAGTDVRSYRNGDSRGHDLVVDVPRALAPLLPYQHVREPLIDVTCSPDHGDPWLAFRYHHFRLYCRAFGCGGPATLLLK